jgi:hypothetical protein
MAAFQPFGIPVVLDHLRVSCFVVHVIDVLGDHRFEHSHLFHPGQQIVGRIGLCILEVLIEYF